MAGAGRMGQEIAAQVDAASDLNLMGIWRRGEDLDTLLDGADVCIDFSLPAATQTVFNAATAHGTPVVCGVSGLDDAQRALIGASADTIPVLYDRNMSVGIALLVRSVVQAAQLLGDEYQVHVAETHHVHKLDAPSGTALMIGEAIAAARDEKGTGSTTFESERRGEVPGDHRVTLTSDKERLTYEHSVTTRDVFAQGAVRAARWLAGQSAGLYSMQDILFHDSD